LVLALRSFVKANHLGTVLESNAGFRMSNTNIRAPDVSFVSYARMNALGFKRTARRFFPAAPDLAVEVLSLNNTRKEINERLKDFFSSGTMLAWIIDPKSKRVEVCRSLTERRWVGNDGFLDGEDLLPGFRYPVADLFKVWDWE
jgi:Uma2 family endonuclease